MKTSIATIIGLVALAFATPGMAAKRRTNRQVIDRFFEIVDSKQGDRLVEVEAPNLVFTTPLGVTKGPEGHKQLLTGFATAFPNFKHTTKRCVESGDFISCEGRFSGDHTGPMMQPDGKSVPATGKHLEFDYVNFARIKDGKIVEMRSAFDLMTLMQQLGLVPSPAETASR